MEIDIKKCREALVKLIHGNFSLHVPPEKDDADILIADALNELERRLKMDQELMDELMDKLVEKLKLDNVRLTKLLKQEELSSDQLVISLGSLESKNRNLESESMKLVDLVAKIKKSKNIERVKMLIDVWQDGK